jgi:hypothetical protein
MSLLEDQLRRYAQHLDTAAPVTAAEARRRADESMYAGEGREVVVAGGGRGRRRHWLSIVAVLLVLALVAVFVKSSSTAPTSSTNPYHLPEWVPDGMELADTWDTAQPPLTESIATLLRTDRPGVIRLFVAGLAPGSGVSAATPHADLTDPVTIQGHLGLIQSRLDGWSQVSWSDGTRLYVVEGTGASDAELVATAASVRPDDTGGPQRLDVAPPPGWNRLAGALPVKSSVSLMYTAADRRVLFVSLFAGAGGVVNRLARALPNGRRVAAGGAHGVAVNWGDWTTTDVALADGALVEINSVAVPEADVMRFAGSLHGVSAAAWDAVPIEGFNVYPYQPPDDGYRPLLIAGDMGLTWAEGPDGSWCLRVPQATTAMPLVPEALPWPAASGCFTQLGPSTVTGAVPTFFPTERAVFGLTEASAVSVVVELADGSSIDAHVARIGNTQASGWLAVLPVDATIRAIQATDSDNGASWRVGRPPRPS